MKKEYEEKLKHAQQKGTLSGFSSQTDFDPPPIQSTAEESPRNPTGITITNLTSQIKVLKNQIQTMESQMEALDNSRNQTNKELIQLQQNYENLYVEFNIVSKIL
jgi:chromosome segregation ATPase